MSLLFLFSCGLLHLDPWYFLPDEVHEPGMWHNFQILLFSNMYIIYICVNGILKEKKQDQRVLLTYYTNKYVFALLLHTHSCINLPLQFFKFPQLLQMPVDLFFFSSILPFNHPFYPLGINMFIFLHFFLFCFTSLFFPSWCFWKKSGKKVCTIHSINFILSLHYFL